MHERINELIVRAVQLVADEHTKGDVYRLNTDANQVKNLINEKFAELIVKECLTVIGKERRAMLDKADLAEAHIMQKSAIAIIKHFEFKE